MAKPLKKIELDHDSNHNPNYDDKYYPRSRTPQFKNILNPQKQKQQEHEEDFKKEKQINEENLLDGSYYFVESESLMLRSLGDKQKEQKAEGKIQLQFQNADLEAAKKNDIKKWVQTVGSQKYLAGIQKLGLSKKLIQDPIQLQIFISEMNIDALNSARKQVKHLLRSYDSDFESQFNRPPIRQQKLPILKLYKYYKKLRGQEQSEKNPEVSEKIKEIKNQRKELRIKIEQFEANFQIQKGRKLKSTSDINPIKKEYDRYKQLKKLLEALQSVKYQ